MRILEGYRVYSFSVIFILISVLSMYWRSTQTHRGPASADVLVEDVKEFKLAVIKTLRIEGPSVSLQFSAKVCRSYPWVEMTLEVDGRSVNGEPVQMSLNRPCLDLNPSDNFLTWAFDIASPMSQLFKKRYVQDFDKAENWFVREVRLHPLHEQTPIVISSYEIISVLGHPGRILF